MSTELNIYAYGIKRGDYIYRTKENGKAFGGSSYVQRVTVTDDTVTYTVAAGMSDIDVTVPSNTPVTVER